MNIIFKNTTKYTQEKYAEFLKFHDSKYGIQYRILTIIVSIIILYMVASNIVAKNMTLVYILFIAFVVFLFYRYFSQEKIVKNEIKGETLQKQKEYTFTFFEKEFEVKEGLKRQRVQYNQIYRVFESEEFFYMYTDKNHSLMLSKSGFEIGNSVDFADSMKKKYSYKFKPNRNNFKGIIP